MNGNNKAHGSLRTVARHETAQPGSQPRHHRSIPPSVPPTAALSIRDASCGPYRVPTTDRNLGSETGLAETVEGDGGEPAPVSLAVSEVGTKAAWGTPSQRRLLRRSRHVDPGVRAGRLRRPVVGRPTRRADHRRRRRIFTYQLSSSGVREDRPGRAAHAPWWWSPWTGSAAPCPR